MREMIRRCRMAMPAIAVLLLVACDDDATGPAAAAGVETAVVLNSVELSFTAFAVDSPDATRTIGLGPDGSPASLAARKELAVAPLGIFPALAVADLSSGDVGQIALPASSGATGAAFLDDSIVYVGNSNLNSVSVVNVRSGQVVGAQIPVGVFPQAIVISGDRVFVLDAELDSNFEPARPGRVSVIDATTRTVVDSIILSGLNPTNGAIGPDGLLYIVNAGRFGQGDGSLSVVSTASLEEIEHHTGFGEFPGSIVIDEDGIAFVAAFAYGIAVWDTRSDSFVHSPADPLVVQGVPSSGGVGLDSSGRLYTLVPDCTNPSQALRLDPSLAFDRSIDVGICPFGIAFTAIPE